MKYIRRVFLVLILSFVAFSCSGGYENSSLTFKLPGNSLADESSSSVTNTYSLKIILSGDFSSEKEWTIDDSFYNSSKTGTFKIEDLPSGKNVSLVAEIFQNGSLIYVSDALQIELLPGENDISISVHKVEDTDSDRGGDSSTGDGGTSSGETDTSGESGDSSGETGGSTDSGDSSGETGGSTDSGDSSGGTGGSTDSGDSSGETGGSTDSGDSSGETGGSTDSGDSSGETGGSTESGDTSTQTQTVSETFVKVTGATITGSSQTNNYAGVFIEGRTVTLSDFYISNIEVTQALYANYMANQTVSVDGTKYTLSSNPSLCLNSDSGNYLTVENQNNRPVDNVTWYDAVYFCNVRSSAENLTPAYIITVSDVSKINEDDDCNEYHITGASVTLVGGANGYRLPTEAEWEFAARGGDTSKDDWNYRYSGASTSLTSYDDTAAQKDSDLDAVGWYAYNNNGGTTGESNCTASVSGVGSHEVAKKSANALGLYDMSGNVFEWCYDYYDSISASNENNPNGPTSTKNFYRVTRGGSWYYYASYASVFYRGGYASADTKEDHTGFRLARSYTDSSN